MKTTLGLCAVAALGLLGYLAVTNRSATLHLAAEIARDMNAARAKVLQTLHPQEKPIENALSGELKNIEKKMKKLEDKASSNSDEEFAQSSFPEGRESPYSSLPIDVLTNKVVDRIIEQYLSGILPFTLDKPDAILQSSFRPSSVPSSPIGTDSGTSIGVMGKEKKHKAHRPIIPIPVKPRMSEQPKSATSPTPSPSTAEEEAANEKAVPVKSQGPAQLGKKAPKAQDSVFAPSETAYSKEGEQESPAPAEQTVDYNEPE